MRSCPHCKLINPSDAVRCDCGCDFVSGLGGPEPRSFLLRPLVIRNFGIALFSISLVLPYPVFGFQVFYLAPLMAFHSFQTHPDQRIFLIGLLVSWCANFTIFFRLPVWAALFAVVLPWSVYACGFSMAARFIPFYPWAFGIALIHLSRIMKPWPDKSPGPTTVDAGSSAVAVRAASRRWLSLLA